MANSGKNRSFELSRLVEDRLRSDLRPGAKVIAGLSGGVDSVTLVNILVTLRDSLRLSLRAIHVNHGLSPHADDWGDFCAGLCSDLNIPLTIERADLSPWRSFGVEGAAREARYKLLENDCADALLLGHHRDDQAETLLVQLLRGAGAPGLAAMPLVSSGRTKIIRPFLDVPRSEIERYARTAGFSWIDDESNTDLARPRNFLRHAVLPTLEAQYPGVTQRIARSASHIAEASQLLRELGQIDFDACASNGALSISRLRDLGEVRARNLIRFWAEMRGFQAAPTSATVELWRQLCDSRRDAKLEVRVGGACYRRYRDALYLEGPIISVGTAISRTWAGEAKMVLMELHGTLYFTHTLGAGLSAKKLKSGKITVRTRVGGERIRPDSRRPSRSLKSIFQQFGIPGWKRQLLPLIFCDEDLVSIPGLTDDCAWGADVDEPSVLLTWKDDDTFSELLLKDVERLELDPDSTSLT